MARMTVTLPDQLALKIRAQPGLNVSGVLQLALWELVECRHDRLACQSCAKPVDVSVGQGEALARFYGDVMDRLEGLVARSGTAEGAARAVKEVAQRHGCADDGRPVPRPTRAERQTVNDRRWLDEQQQSA